MPRKKSVKEESFLIHPNLAETKEILKLIEQGYTVDVMSSSIAKYDMILGPNCWRMTVTLMAWLKVAVAACRNAVKRRKAGLPDEEESIQTPEEDDE